MPETITWIPFGLTIAKIVKTAIGPRRMNDADKTGYDGYYELCSALLRPGGVITVDNALWDGSAANPAKDGVDTRATRAVNEQISRDRRVETYLAAVGDGVHLARKR